MSPCTWAIKRRTVHWNSNTKLKKLLSEQQRQNRREERSSSRYIQLMCCIFQKQYKIWCPLKEECPLGELWSYLVRGKRRGAQRRSQCQQIQNQGSEDETTAASLRSENAKQASRLQTHAQVGHARFQRIVACCASFSCVQQVNSSMNDTTETTIKSTFIFVKSLELSMRVLLRKSSWQSMYWRRKRNSASTRENAVSRLHTGQNLLELLFYLTHP